MKGGRTAPRDAVLVPMRLFQLGSFNEGGADCPPRPGKGLTHGRPPLASMKGGRTAPRDSRNSAAAVFWQLASMKGGRTAPRDDFIRLGIAMELRASMKGGRTAPRDCPPFFTG